MVVFAYTIRRMCVSSSSSDASGGSRNMFMPVPSPWDASVVWRSQHSPDAPPLAKASKMPGNIDEEDLGNECVGPEDVFPETFTPLPLRELSDRMKLRLRRIQMYGCAECFCTLGECVVCCPLLVCFPCAFFLFVLEGSVTALVGPKGQTT